MVTTVASFVGAGKVARAAKAPDELYRRAIEFIALNDNDGAADACYVKAVRGYMTTVLVAETFGVSTMTVARDVVKLRRERFV